VVLVVVGPTAMEGRKEDDNDVGSESGFRIVRGEAIKTDVVCVCCFWKGKVKRKRV